ncbi:ANTH-domain-containing protein [Saccharata proteae CBS 121410]|uniref:ANTH-domain-containing protein n=1 Tax=Saccharata proteae CBS 121410 TaxID=1314787 RepID=A0A9P4HSE6_9PEZI|nr:ANTH-domain-containing protein [Saccharata proteae CBS 121410]
MASSFEKSVKGGTKIKLAPPKSKYVEHILVATHAGEAGVAEVFRALQNRLRDSTWTIVFKSLIIVHLMIREGEPDVTLRYLAQSPQRRLAINNFTEVQTQGRAIRAYAEYLMQRAVSFGATRVDYVRSGEGRLKRLTVDKGLLRETEQVQDQIRALLHCDFLSHEPENEITLTAFRLLTMDLLALFHIMNEGTINVLEHYFEMSHPDAERALKIYRSFTRQTEMVVQFLSIARLHEHSTRLEIPKIKHAPTSLTNSLEEYLNDKDFEVNRRQYLAQQDGKKGGQSNGASRPFGDTKPKATVDSSFPDSSSNMTATQPAPTAVAKGPAPDLIDFFESIEQNQQPMADQGQAYQQQQVQYPQQTGMGFAPQPGPFDSQQTGFAPQATGFPQQQMPAQSTNPFGQVQPPAPLQVNYTGAGFGGYTPQPQPFNAQPTGVAQNGFQQPQFTGAPAAEQLQPQSTNPFRQSMMMTGSPSSAFPAASNATGLQRSATNPFAKQLTPQQTGYSPSLPPIPSHQPMAFAPQQQQQPQPLQPQPTGTNPFAKNASPAQGSAPGPPHGGLMPNVTGSTNPFRQSAFVNQQTGQGWQSGPQNTMGGLEQLDTVPVFPRPGQPTQQQHPGWS